MKDFVARMRTKP